MSHVINDVTHNVFDDDGIFVIEPSTREITYTINGEAAYYDLPVLVKGDLNSERLTFKIPKTIEGHDMTACDLIRIHYITIDAKTSAQYKDAYDVPESDRVVSDGDDFVFTWLIDRNVTQSAGPISFVVQFACTKEVPKDGATYIAYEYSWSTVPYRELSVSDAIVNDKTDADDFVDEYNSIVIQWHNEIEEAIARSDASVITRIEQTTVSTENQGVNVWTATFGNGDTVEFEVQNGSQGSDGLSAYQVAVNNGFKGSEEEWIESLKATGYEDCLKGVTLTREEYDSLSDAEKNREDFVYIIQSETLHADTADSAETATVAAGYTDDGEIAAAILEINKAIDEHTHDELSDYEDRASALENTVGSIVNEPIEITGRVTIPYTVELRYGENASQFYQVIATTQIITAPEGCIFKSVETTLTSSGHSITQSAITAVISEDGKTIDFGLSTGVSTMIPSTGSAIIEYSCGYVSTEFTSAYHAQNAQNAESAQSASVADNLSLNNTFVYELDGTNAPVVNLSSGRAYMISLDVNYGLGVYTGLIYLPQTPSAYSNACLSTIMSTGLSDTTNYYYCSLDLGADQKWRANVVKNGKASSAEGTITFIEL